ncbi:unnamed protein product [Prorocentrum cordatum]|uniref:Uncharacterized protein n=1 Tax=Prorocentrum cordatum TaxID=2364126 RepID=A0ABN9SKZ2_9DINO|nr:unnamed protein product [Polarella glacialis]
MSSAGTKHLDHVKQLEAVTQLLQSAKTTLDRVARTVHSVQAETRASKQKNVETRPVHQGREPKLKSGVLDLDGTGLFGCDGEDIEVTDNDGQELTRRKCEVQATSRRVAVDVLGEAKNKAEQFIERQSGHDWSRYRAEKLERSTSSPPSHMGMPCFLRGKGPIGGRWLDMGWDVLPGLIWVHGLDLDGKDGRDPSAGSFCPRLRQPAVRQDLDGPTVSMLCQQLMDLQRNVAVLAEKVDLLSQPAVQVHSSMMVTGDSAWGKHRNPSGASLEPGAGSTAALGRGRPQDWLRRLQPNDEAVDFGAFGAATERISDAVNAGVASIQGFSSSSKRMATNIASGISEKITASGGRLTSSFG